MNKKKDLFYEKILKKIFKIEKIEKTFWKKYYIRGKKFGKFEGTYTRCCLSRKYETSIVQLKNEMDETIDNMMNETDSIKIVYCLKGEGVFSFIQDNEKKVYHVRKGNVIVYRFDEKIKQYRIKSNNLEYISTDIFLNEIVPDLTDDKNIMEWRHNLLSIFNREKLHFGITNKEIDILAKEIKNASIKNINDYLFFKSKVFRFVIAIFRLQYKNYEEIEIIVKKAKEILEKCKISELPTVKELCEVMNVSRYQMQLAFKKSEGMEATKYLKKIKMEYAKTMIITTNKNIGDIANETGYENPSKFSEAFKNYFGVLPNKYRKIN